MKNKIYVVFLFLLMGTSNVLAQRCNPNEISVDCGNITAQGGLAGGTNTVFCDSSIVTFENSSVGVIDSTYYCWGDGAITGVVGTAPASHRYILRSNVACSQIFTIQMTVVRRCAGGFVSVHNITTRIVVQRKPRAVINTTTSNLCVGVPFTLTNASTCVSPSRWDFGNGVVDSINRNPTYTYPTPGNYTIRLISQGCQGVGDTATRNVTVYGQPVARAGTASSTSTNGCSPLTINFNNQSQNGGTYTWAVVSGPTGYTFDGGTNRNSANPIMTFRDTGTYRLRLTNASQYCGSSSWDTLIYVRSAPTVSLASVATGCNSMVVRPSQIVTYSNGVPTTYSWTFSNITPATSNVRLPADITYPVGNYTISLTATNVCGSSTSSVNFSVTAPPSGGFSAVTNPPNNCIPADVQFQSNVSNASTYSWQVVSGGAFTYQGGTSAASANPLYRLTSTGTYRIRMTATGCSSITKDTTITLITLPSVSLDSVTNACLPLTVNPSAIVRYTGGTPTSYLWNFIGGSRLTDNVRNPAAVTFNTPGQYSIAVAATNICGTGRDTTSFRVDSLPQVTASVLPDNAIYCAPASITFSNNSKFVFTHRWVVTSVGRYRFTGGTNATSANPIIEFLDEGTYTVQLIGNGCVTDTWTKTIQVLAPPSVSLASVPDGCETMSVNPGAIVTYSGGTPARYSWTFAGRTPDSSNLRSPAALTYGVGTHSIIVRSINACATAADTVNFTVVPPPVIGAVALSSNPNGCVPVDISLRSQTQNASSYTWSVVNSSNFSFVSGTNANSDNAVLRFNDVGSYQIRLNVMGCRAAQWDTTITLITAPSVSLAAVPDGCQSMSVNPGALVSYAGGTPTRYAWTFTGVNPDSSNLRSPTAITYTPGTYSIIARAINVCATASDTVNFTVVPAPVIGAVVSPSNPNGCVPVDISLQSRTQNASSYTWSVLNTTNFSFVSGTNANSQNAIVRFNDAGSYQIRLNVMGCRAAQWDTTITLIAPPSVSLAAVPDACQATTITPGALVTYAGGTPTRYAWTFTGVNPDSSNLRNPTAISYTPGTYSIIARAINVCATASDTVNFTVIPAPVIRAVVTPSNPNGCVPVDINLQSQTQNASSYTWSVLNSTNYAFVNSTTANSDNAVVRFNAAGSYQIRLNVMGCRAAQWDTTITLITSPSVSLAAVTDNCSPQSIFPSSLVSYSGGTPTQYNWTFVGGTPATSTVRSPSAVVFSNIGLNKIIVQTENVCGSSTDTVSFYLNGPPAPRVITSLSDTNKCSPLELSFNTAFSNFVTSYRWTAQGANFINGTNTSSPSPNIRYTSAGTYAIRLDADGCGTARWDTTITVSIPPSVSLVPVNDTCGSITVNPASIVQYGGGTPNSYRWTFTNTSVAPSSLRLPSAINYTRNGTYSIISTVENQCGMSTDTIAFSLRSRPSITLTPLPLICNSATPTQLQATPSNGTWVGTSVTSGGLFNPSTAILGINTLYYNVGAGQCANTDSISVEVGGAIVNAGNDLEICQNQTGTILTGATPANGIWSGTGITDTINGVFDPRTLTAGVYTVTYTIRNNRTGCVNRSSRQIIVHPAPRAAFDSVGTSCLGVAAFFRNTSTGVDAVNWDFGDATANSNLLSPTHIYNRTGRFRVWLRVNTSQGCVDSTSRLVDVSRPGVAAFVPDVREGCGPLLPISFSNRTTGQNLRYNWNFGTGLIDSTSTPPVVLFRQSNYDTFYVVRLTVSNTCGVSTATDTIHVRPRPTANFGIRPRNDCSPMVVDFSNASLGYPTSFFWDFGNGRTSRDSVIAPITYRTDTTMRIYNVSLIVGNVCGSDTLTQPLRVFPPEVTAFFALDTLSGCAPFTVNCRNFSTVGSQVWWDSGNGVTSFSTSVFTHTYNTPGFYTITLYAANPNGCGFDSTQRRIQVLPPAEVGFIHPPSVCMGDTLRLQDTSRAFIFRIWQFGDGDSSRILNAIHVYDRPGNFTISMLGNTLNGNCAVVRSSQVLVRPLPNAGFVPDRTDGCPPLSVAFQNRSSTNAIYSAWDFGDGNSTNTSNPLHTYTRSGNYAVRLRVADNFGCRNDTIYNSIVVHPVPTALFEVAPEKRCGLPTRVQFNNRSIGAVGSAWNFGNGQSSIATNPTTSYSVENNFSIRLIATNSFFCADTTVQTFRTYNQPLADFTLTPQQGCAPLRVQFRDASTFATGRRLWSFGDGDTDTTLNPTHLYERHGNFTPSLIVNNGPVCFDTLRLTDIVSVLQNPIADFSYRDSIVQRPNGVIIFKNETQFGQSYTWNFGDNTGTSSLENPTHRYMRPTEHRVTLWAKAANGCRDSISKPVTPKFFAGLFIPNAFSPDNGIETIRRFLPQGMMLKTYKLAIYSAYGDLIWQTDKLEQGKPVEGWDGTKNGVPLPQDVYVWKVQATFEDGSIWVGMPDQKGNYYTTGTLTLLR